MQLHITFLSRIPAKYILIFEKSIYVLMSIII